jgi:1-acyl-sn-glycerol-3-phosphate acyltransferase
MKDRDPDRDQGEWQYGTASDLDKPPIERLRQFPREPDYSVMTLRLIGSVALRSYLSVIHRYRVEGREHLPTGDCSYVVVANHSSHFDALCLLGALPWRRIHRTYPAAAKDYFFEKPPHTIVAGIFINAIPFDRLQDSEGSLDLCRQVLAGRGNSLILFPEGTRAQDGALTRFRTGIGRLVAGTEIPVVPCFLEPPWRAFPKGAFLPRPVKLTARFGAARTFEHCAGDKAGFIEVANTLHADVASLGGRTIAGESA